MPNNELLLTAVELMNIEEFEGAIEILENLKQVNFNPPQVYPLLTECYLSELREAKFYHLERPMIKMPLRFHYSRVRGFFFRATQIAGQTIQINNASKPEDFLAYSNVMLEGNCYLSAAINFLRARNLGSKEAEDAFNQMLTDDNLRIYAESVEKYYFKVFPTRLFIDDINCVAEWLKDEYKEGASIPLDSTNTNSVSDKFLIGESIETEFEKAAEKKEELKRINVDDFCNNNSSSIVIAFAKKLIDERYFDYANQYLKKMIQKDEVKKEALSLLIRSYTENLSSLRVIAFLLDPNPIPQMESELSYYKRLYEA